MGYHCSSTYEIHSTLPITTYLNGLMKFILDRTRLHVLISFCILLYKEFNVAPVIIIYFKITLQLINKYKYLSCKPVDNRYPEIILKTNTT